MTSGLLTSILDLTSQTQTTVSQSFYWYNSSVGNKESGQASGAYIFRPNQTAAIPLYNGQSVNMQVVQVRFILPWSIFLVSWTIVKSC